MPVAQRKRRSREGGDATRKSSGVSEVSGATRKRRVPEKLDDLYGGGDFGNLLHPDFDREDVYAWFQRRHLNGSKLVDDDGVYRRGDHEWKVPYGVRIALKTRLIYGQIVVKYPFAVAWTSPSTGRRMKKNFTSLIGAIHFCATKAQYVDESCSIIAKVVGYDVPPKLRGKFPLKRGKRVYYWCPFCMDARRFKRHPQGREFFALKKFWNEDKQRWDWAERRLAVLVCTCCGNSNQDQKFRRGNQPYEVRKIKKGVRRVKRRKK